MSYITNKDKSGTGDVVGPSSSTDNAIARFDGTTGELIKNSVVLIDNSGNVTGANNITLGGLTANRMVITGASGILQTPAALTNGQLFIGSTGNQPQAGAITSTGNTITVTLGAGTINLEVASSFSGTAQTIGASSADLITVPLSNVPGNYTFQINVSGFESGTPSGVGSQLIALARTDGSSASLVGPANKIFISDAATMTASIDLVVSGNNAIVRVSGVIGIDINWKGFLSFVYSF